MAADVAILIGTLTLGLATSVVGACLYLHRLEIDYKLRALLAGGNKIADPQMMLDQTYQDLQDNLIQTRHQIKSALKLETDLTKQLHSAQHGLDRFDVRIAADMSVEASTSDAIGKKRQEINKLAEQLAQQQNKTTALKEKQADQEAEVQKAYTKKQVLMARDTAAKASQAAERILSSTSPAGMIASLEKLEADVGAREAEALAFINRLSKLFSQDAIEELEMEELDHMVPILPHAVEQLGKAIDHIAQLEIEIEQLMQKNAEILDTWKLRAENAIEEDKLDLAKLALERAKTFAEALDHHATQLEQMRQHNVELRKTQADFETMVEKLSGRIGEMKAEHANKNAGEKLASRGEDSEGEKQ